MTYCLPLEAEMSLPAHMGLVGSLGGIPLIENDLLDYDEMYIATEQSAVVVGEIAHFAWRLEQLSRNESCRALARQHIETTASRILGEPWEVSPK